MHNDSGEGHGGLAHWGCHIPQYYCKKIVKIMEHVKSVGILQSIMVNPKRSAVMGEMEHLLKVWMYG
jgi:hypothetical protein